MNKSTRRISTFAVFIALGQLHAEAISAQPLSGPGDYEFLFFSGDKKPEIEALTARFREIDPELQNLHNELKKAEDELASAGAQGTGKRKQRLEWSPIEGVTGYSVKLFDAKKKQIDVKATEENSLTVELDQGDYFFQVAAVTKYKTGTYSRMTAFKIGKGKPGAAQLAAEERAEKLREKIKIQRSIRGEYLKTLRSLAIGDASANDAKADVNVPAGAAVYFAINKKTEPYTMSQVQVLPGRDANKGSAPAAAVTQRAADETSAFFWGAGAVVGVQDTRLDFFRMAIGAEGFLRYEKPFLKFFHPQFKTMLTYSGGKTSVYDAMLYANFYPGIYYPITLGKGFRFLVSLSTGANMFLILSSAASSSVLQWGFMPAFELQFALNDKLSIYAGGGLNLTYDPNAGSGFFSSASWLKFFPFNAGVTRRF
jgi:hypothetical protein